MQWRLILEEYSPELISIQGSKNIAADILSRLDIAETPIPVKNNMKSINKHYVLEDKDISHPTNNKTIMQNQQKDKEFIKIVQNNKDYSVQNFHGASKKYSLICKNRKIVIPKQLEKQVSEWYNNILCHQRETRTELSIFQYFYWKNLRKIARKIGPKCKTCQFLKRNKKQYGSQRSRNYSMGLSMCRPNWKISMHLQRRREEISNPT